jgi:GMP synthase (glutamine-hydrolysing)
MQRQVLMIVHQATSITGRVGRLLRSRGYVEDIRCPNLGQALPASLDEYAGVVMFGGPMSANDDHEPGVRAELDWLPRVLMSDTPFLGVCLGAQILARVLGGSVWEHPEQYAEIGYYEVRATAPGRAYLPESMHIYQWHRESFDLPKSATLLASSDLFENQAFRYGDRHFGLQFHPDVTRDMLMRWSCGGARRLVLPGAQGPEAQRRSNLLHDGAVEQWCRQFLDRWLGDSQIAA